MPKSDPVLVPPTEYLGRQARAKAALPPCPLEVMWGYRNWHHIWLASWVPVQASGPEAASLTWLSLQGTPIKKGND